MIKTPTAQQCKKEKNNNEEKIETNISHNC